MSLKSGVAVSMVVAGCVGWGCSGEDLKPIIARGDAGTSADAASTGATGTWTWLDVPESECANGEPTGFAVNQGTSKDLVIFLEGGGACWDEASCFVLKTAANIDGFQKPQWESTLANGVGGLEGPGLFNRTAANNPYKDSSYVYIPYCTADVHAGEATREFQTRAMHFSGRKNIAAFLAKIAPSFPDATRVTMAGRSAGGFGAAVNYWRAKQTFPNVRVDLLDDSGPPFDQPTIANYPTWSEAWNIAGALPPDCTECQTNVNAALPYYSRTYPNSRFALLSYTQDGVISTFYGQSGEAFEANLKTLTQQTLAPLPNLKYFVISGTDHTMVQALDKTSGGKVLGDWINEFATDAAGWASVSPL